MTQQRDRESGKFVSSVDAERLLDQLDVHNGEAATAEVANGTMASHRRVLELLTDLLNQGRVRRRKVGQAWLWSLSPDHEPARGPASYPFDEPNLNPDLLGETGRERLLRCNFCDQETELTEEFCTHCHACIGVKRSINEDMWMFADTGFERKDDRGTGATVSFGVCARCGVTYLDRALDQAREKGTVPCLAPRHNSHTVSTLGASGFSSSQIEQCVRSRCVPLDQEGREAVYEAWQSVREDVCPECGRTAEEIEEVTLTKEIHNKPAKMIDGLSCACGWEGAEHELGFRKTKSA